MNIFKKMYMIYNSYDYVQRNNVNFAIGLLFWLIFLFMAFIWPYMILAIIIGSVSVISLYFIYESVVKPLLKLFKDAKNNE